jgi:RimJ/RimL family protein N-acetyltransferase
MTAVVKTMIESWAVPHMNARKFHTEIFPENIGSQKVFLKNGFHFTGNVAGAVKFPESKGGFIMDCLCFAREVPVSEAI